MSQTIVVSVKKTELVKRGFKNFAHWNSQPNALYIGRNMEVYVPGAIGSKWANPYPVKKYDLENCLRLYEEHILKTPSLYNSLEELQGKELGCWCKPCACHGDVLIKLLEQKIKENTKNK